MISEKFKANCPPGFLDKIKDFEISKFVYFACDFEYSESMSYEEKLFIIGKFHTIDKVSPKHNNCFFFDLSNRDKWTEVIEEILELYLSTFNEVLLKVLSASKSGVVDAFEYNFANTLSPFLILPSTSIEIVDVLKSNSKDIGIENCEIIDSPFDLKEISHLEQFAEVDFQIPGDHLLIPNFLENNLIRLQFLEPQPNRVFLSQLLIKTMLPNSEKKVDFNIVDNEYPIVVLRNENDIVFSNQKFLNLEISPNEVAKNKNGDFLKGNTVIVIDELESLEDTKIYLFMPMTEVGEDVLSQSSQEELGIICSSIAHELNNPIGGIINAFQLLNLLNDFDEGTKTIVDEMTKSIERAHRLVNLFLGFVKTDIQKKESQDVDPCLNQAVDLLRGRMVKEGCFINLDLGTEKGRQFSFNQSVMTIVFYIISSELLTRFARETLVKNSGKNEKSLEIQVQKTPERLILVINSLNNGFNALKDSHLLKYLVQSQKIQLDFKEQEIHFTWP